LVAGEADRLEIADKKMNAAYQKVLGILDSDGKAALREAQRKWLAWRDAQAELRCPPVKGWKALADGAARQHCGTNREADASAQGDYKRFKDG
jgi:uncharacterized protein YecT (DUF1311 family)